MPRKLETGRVGKLRAEPAVIYFQSNATKEHDCLLKAKGRTRLRDRQDTILDSGFEECTKGEGSSAA